ncbi:hypothetical protein NMR74_003339 [Vibrio parahaemolyticus]|nr:hypothetical protein [Vibrio parahaemolyticus]
MEIIPLLIVGFMLVFLLLIVIANWRVSLVLVLLGVCVFLITTYTKYVAVLVFTVSSILKYWDSRESGSPSISSAIFSGIKVTIAVVLLGFAVTGVLNVLGSHEASHNCSRIQPVCN